MQLRGVCSLSQRLYLPANATAGMRNVKALHPKGGCAEVGIDHVFRLPRLAMW
jgi:hypothetical protein